MAAEKTAADSLRVYCTGASTDAGHVIDPNASLGKYRGGREVTSLEVYRATPIRGIEVVAVSALNGIGTGSLAVTGDSTVTWTPPGGTVGAAVTILDGEVVIVEGGTDTNKWIRIRRTQSDALAGNEDIDLFEVMNNEIGFDDVTNAEGAAGDLEYRAVALANVTPNSITSCTVHILPLATAEVGDTAQMASSGTTTVGTSGSFAAWPARGFARRKTSGGTLKELVYYSARTDTVLTVSVRGLASTTVEVSASDDTFEPVPGVRIAKETPSSRLLTDKTGAGEGSAPTVTWNSGITAATGLSVGTLTTLTFMGIWIERIIPAGMIGDPAMVIALEVNFVDAGSVARKLQVRGRYRVAQDSLERYELFRGEDTDPDFTASAWETFTSFPHQTAALTTETVSKLVLRKRNRYNLSSINTISVDFDIQADASNAGMPPQPPILYSATQTGTGAITITGLYDSTFDDDEGLTGTHWAVWVAYDGIEPDPTDPADVEEAFEDTPIALKELSLEITGINDERSYAVLVRIRREGTPDVDSTNLDFKTGVIDDTQPRRVKGHTLLNARDSVPADRYPLSTGTSTFTIDVGNDVKVVHGHGSASLYWGSTLLWRAILGGANGGVLYIPNTAALDWRLVLSPAKTGPSTITGSSLWFNTGADHAGAASVGRIEMDTAAAEFKTGCFERRQTLDVKHSNAAVYGQDGNVYFQAFDPDLEDWRTYAALLDEDTGVLATTLDINAILSQAAIVALV